MLRKDRKGVVREGKDVGEKKNTNIFLGRAWCAKAYPGLSRVLSVRLANATHVSVQRYAGSGGAFQLEDDIEVTTPDM